VGVGLTFVNFRGCFKPFCSFGAHGRRNNRTRRVSGKNLNLNFMETLNVEKMEKIEGGYDYRGLICFAVSVVMANSFDANELRAAFWTSVNLGCEA
jgi:hypothetical protein